MYTSRKLCYFTVACNLPSPSSDIGILIPGPLQHVQQPIIDTHFTCMQANICTLGMERNYIHY